MEGSMSSKEHKNNDIDLALQYEDGYIYRGKGIAP